MVDLAQAAGRTGPHLDTKKLGRIKGIGHRIAGRRRGAINRHHGIGWEALHVAIDDASRLAYIELLADEKKRAPLPSSAVRLPGSPATASPSSGS